MATRTLTILFTDLVGSTEIRSTLGDHKAELLRRSHFGTLRRQLDRHGGREVKSLGDGVMATFEAARSAIECAVAMQIAVAIPDRLTRAARIRVGISSGDVTLVEDDCFGVPVIEASRLCQAATGDQVLLAEATRQLVRDYKPLQLIGPLDLKGLPDPTVAWEAPWTPARLGPVRAVIADDAVLVREGVAQILEAAGIEVVGQAGDGAELMALTAEHRPDIAIVDVRMPPTHTLEGLEAAERILAEHPSTGVLVLTQELEPRYAQRLANASSSRVGYLLKESVTDIHAFTDAARQVAAGGIAFEPGLLKESEVRR